MPKAAAISKEEACLRRLVSQSEERAAPSAGARAGLRALLDLALGGVGSHRGAPARAYADGLSILRVSDFDWALSESERLLTPLAMARIASGSLIARAGLETLNLDGADPKGPSLSDFERLPRLGGLGARLDAARRGDSAESSFWIHELAPLAERSAQSVSYESCFVRVCDAFMGTSRWDVEAFPRSAKVWLVAARDMARFPGAALGSKPRGRGLDAALDMARMAESWAPGLFARREPSFPGSRAAWMRSIGWVLPIPGVDPAATGHFDHAPQISLAEAAFCVFDGVRPRSPLDGPDHGRQTFDLLGGAALSAALGPRWTSGEAALEAASIGGLNGDPRAPDDWARLVIAGCRPDPEELAAALALRHGSLEEAVAGSGSPALFERLEALEAAGVHWGSSDVLQACVEACLGERGSHPSSARLTALFDFAARSESRFSRQPPGPRGLPDLMAFLISRDAPVHIANLLELDSRKGLIDWEAADPTSLLTASEGLCMWLAPGSGTRPVSCAVADKMAELGRLPRAGGAVERRLLVSGWNERFPAMLRAIEARALAAQTPPAPKAGRASRL